jgi:anthranilate synthase/aminodeoxychorismate synthase-like glutamine amidotransferase
MILLIDNYDSFVHNLARYVRELGGDAVVRRNDELRLSDIDALAPSHIILSPGPCSPSEAGISTDVVRRFGPTTPIFGVCLGHQCIGAAYGADVIRAGRPVHGMTSPVIHDGSSIFAGLPSPILATRYHSLVIGYESLPASLRVIAYSADDGQIMAVEHRSYPVVGVQFHPESAATEYGYALIDRFMRRSRDLWGELNHALPKWADSLNVASDVQPASDPPWAARAEESGGTFAGPSHDARARDPFVAPPVTILR